MASKQVFVDSDILLDMLLEREPFYAYAQLLMIESKEKGYSLNTSALVIANMNYILGRSVTKQFARESIKRIIRRVNVLPADVHDINMALESKFIDLEDGIQYHIAQKHFCEIILTRNIKDYKEATIPVLTAEQFLRTL